MPSKKPAINISVPCNHRGLHYQGVSLQDGVNLEVIDAPCGPARQMLKFSNFKEGSAPEGIFFDQVSCIDDKNPAVPSYLQIPALK